MERIYVTESGSFNERGKFESKGVIGVDKNAKLAISYIAKKNALAIKREKIGYTNEITYRIEGTIWGYRISIHKI